MLLWFCFVENIELRSYLLVLVSGRFRENIDIAVLSQSAVDFSFRRLTID